MTIEKFDEEIHTLKRFVELYCKDKEHIREISKINLVFNQKQFELKLDLCKECFKTISYSIKRLEECPWKNKPRCRKCLNPCYEKSKWKSLAKIMKYSAIRLGLSKIKQRIKTIFTS